MYPKCNNIATYGTHTSSLFVFEKVTNLTEVAAVLFVSLARETATILCFTSETAAIPLQ